MSNPKPQSDPVAGESKLLQALLSFRAGEPDAFSELARLAAPLLESVVGAFVVSPSEKDDLRQEALIGLYKASLAYQVSLSSFSTFAYLCMRSNVLSFLRRQQKSVPALSEEPDWGEIPQEGGYPDPQHALLDRESAKEWMERMNRVLSPKENRVLALHLQGLGREEIAASLSLSLKSVDNALFRCRKKLKEALE